MKAAVDLERRAVLADPDTFAAITDARARAAADVTDPLVARQLDVLHDAFVPHQVPEELRRGLVELETAVETTYNTFRGELDGETVDDNTILEILRTSDDSDLRRRAWEASKQIGAEVAERVRELARLRNEAAHSLGYRDHFALALDTGEMDESRLFATLDEVDRSTAPAVRDVEGRARLGARDPVRLLPRRAAPVAPRRSVLPGSSRRGRRRPRPVLRRRRPRGAHHAHLRRPRTRSAGRAPAQ